MIFSWFGQQKKEITYPNPGAQIEVEINRDDKSESGFCKLLKLDKKKFTVSLPTSNEKELPGYTGDVVLLIWLNTENILSCTAEIQEAGGSHLGLKRTSNVSFSPRQINSDGSYDISVPVHFRSLSTTHLQTATSHRFTKEGVELITNLPIPAKTELYLEVRVPNSPVLKFRGSVRDSHQSAPGEKKYLTFVEFEAPEPEDYGLLLKHLDFYQARSERNTEKRTD